MVAFLVQCSDKTNLPLKQVLIVLKTGLVYAQHIFKTDFCLNLNCYIKVCETDRERKLAQFLSLRN